LKEVGYNRRLSSKKEKMAKANPQIKAEPRTILGRKVKNLRKQGILPATIYGYELDPISIQINTKEIEKVFDEVGESGLVEILVEDKVLPVLLRNPQYGAVSDDLMHIDCYKVNLKEKITATVPVELIGESPAVKAGNILVQISNEVEVEALPADLPDNFEIDISILEDLEQVITVADIKIGTDKVEMVTPGDQVIVKLEEPKEEEEPLPTEEEVAPGDVPATEQKGETEEGGEAKAEEEKAE